MSLVETQRSDITIGRLLRLAEFYGVRVAELLPDTQNEDALVVRKGEERHLVSRAEGLDVLFLIPATTGLMMPVINLLNPGGELAEFSQHDGEEFVHVLEGIVELMHDGRAPIVLRQGDSAYYSAEIPHSFRNAGNKQVRFLIVATPPTLI